MTNAIALIIMALVVGGGVLGCLFVMYRNTKREYEETTEGLNHLLSTIVRGDRTLH